MKCKRIILPTEVQKHILDQLYSSHMGIDKTKLLARKSIYQTDMNADVENAIKTAQHDAWIFNTHNHRRK